MAEMAREFSREMSHQLSAVISRTGRALRHEDRFGGRGAPPPPRVSIPPEVAAQINSGPYRRSRARMLARKWRLSRVRPNPIGYAVGVATAILLAVALLAGGAGGGLYASNYYNSHVADIQNIANLKYQSSSVIYDRNGTAIYVARNNDDGYSFYVPLDQISPLLQTATLDTEDHTFYQNVGIDFVGTLRALFIDAAHGGQAAQGGSTITQQLVKRVVLKDSTKAVQRKINEAILAYGVTQQYDKRQILEMYLNTIFYGDNNVGIEAAARNYFGLKQTTTPDGKVIPANMQLTLAQAALLAGLPNSPSSYQPNKYSCPKAPCTEDKWDNQFDPNYDFTVNGHERVVMSRSQKILDNMTKYGDITQAQEDDALAQIHDWLINQTILSGAGVQAAQAQGAANAVNLAPHFVEYVLNELADGGITDLATAGLRIYTTLDLSLNQYATKQLKYYIEQPHANPWYPDPQCGGLDCPLKDSFMGNAHNGAVVAIDQHTGDILAMVGSVDYNDKDKRVAGAVNVSTSYRSMGSSTKPLVYATAFQMGWDPAIMMQDVPICFPSDGSVDNSGTPAKACKGFVPLNYTTNNFSGKFPIRYMLGNSLNIAATEAMSFVGDAPATGKTFIATMQRLGIQTGCRGCPSLQRMGPTTALGTQEMPLLQLTGAYGTFANLGKREPYRAILRIENSAGEVEYQASATPQGYQVISPQASYMITSILSDNNARREFGYSKNPLHFEASRGEPSGIQLAAKTGTSSGDTGPLDIVTMGYSPFITLGVWIGNSDSTPLNPGIIGVAGAGYVYHDLMYWAYKNYHWPDQAKFPVPPGLAYGQFNCDSGLAPYKDSKSGDKCQARPYTPGSLNMYDNDAGVKDHANNDLYIQGQAPLQS
jgi:membrane peptidoglycan carboxypeptidase